MTTPLVARLLGMLSLLWGVVVQVFTVVDPGVLSMVKGAYVSLWVAGGLGLLLLKEWGRCAAVVAATAGLVLLLAFSLGTTALVAVTGVAGFHTSRWGWVPEVAAIFTCHIVYVGVLTRPAMKAACSRKAPSKT